MGRRTQADRDAITVEIGYALVSGAVVAAVAFAGIYAPALLFDLTHNGERLLLGFGAGAATLAFLARIVHVLWRFPRVAEGRRIPADQPSQPGRTSPDS
ncbi:DUF6332 family protein [Streptomyces sp. NBC_01433]|uniref:DUF6332 family protein n=1 Tax=Streptomyces sp. NBC_01433 TaxID=2903864 RepID=UPI00224F5687|nr:DUF6332 family protein [Streptomyces sp. NBC_01433]MCX4678920.1 DUF6332 family protein [Streptomyces sp. NBC_01433]